MAATDNKTTDLKEFQNISKKCNPGKVTKNCYGWSSTCNIKSNILETNPVSVVGVMSTSYIPLLET